MKNLITTLFALLITINLVAQSDNCSSATVLGVSANCSSPTAGTTSGATESIAGCVGTADDDVWYQFVATATSHQIVVQPGVGMDPVVQLFSGACATLVSLVCKDNTLDGEAEIINYNGLSIGQTYRIRVYDYYAGSGTGNFTICITNPPPAPSNDSCGGATPLNVNASCSYTSATTDGASQSLAGCSGTADDDVWFQFVATNSLQNITVNPIDDLDLVFQVYSGTCSTLNSINCIDNTFSNQAEQSDIVGLIAGQTYFIRVYDYYQGTTGDFEICITGTPTATPTNDDPCNAIQLPTVTSTCQYGFYTTNGATTTAGPPTPSACVGGNAPQQGGFQSGTQDVWFSVIVPASGNVDITSYPNGGAGYITDGVMALYSGTCGSLTQIACSDDNNYPGSSNDLLPFISASGLTPGSTVFLRYWDWGLGAGNFGICASTVTNDDCANALYICDINGYSASTSASYTADRPDNMHGNNEGPNGESMPNGTNSGGIFGQGGPWGSGSPFYDVEINNNSWIKFTAAATTATLNVSIYDCWVGNYPSGGLQMQIFEGNNCTNFVPVSNFEESSTGFVITANGLTVGNDYYLMIDGFAGDICNYTITAESGVQFPNIAAVAPICEGESVVLTAPSGATSYDWQHSGETTQSVTVTPSTTQTYYCEVSGLCDYKQTLDATVQVKPNPVVDINNAPSISICNGSSTNITATGASSYVWSTAQSGATISVSPSSNTTYTVTGTTDGCTDGATIDIIVNPTPTLSANPVATDSDCGGSNGSLTGAVGSGAPSLQYTWTNSVSAVVGTTADLTGIPAGVYFLEVEDGNGCIANFGGYSVSNPGSPVAPTLTIDDDTPCLDGSSQITITNIDGAATYTWSGPNSFSSGGTSITINNVSPAEVGSYCVSATVAGCSGPSTCQSISISPAPTVDIAAFNNDSTICLNEDFSLTASGASTYSWTGPNGFSETGANQTVNGVTNMEAGYYVVTGIDGNGCSALDSIQISVLTLPNLSLNTSSSNDTYCLNTVANITVSGANSYTWTGPNSYVGSGNSINIFNVTEPNEGYYVAEGTDANGCLASDSIFVTIAENPTLAVNPTAADSDCGGSNGSLTGASGSGTPTISYTWTDGSAAVIGSTADLNGIAAGDYFLTVEDGDGCTADFGPFTVSNPTTPLAPALSVDNNSPCDDGSSQITITNIDGSATYDWTGPNGFSSSATSVSINNITANEVGNYCVTATVAGCTSTITCEAISISPPPIISIAAANNDSTICLNQDFSLSASGATSYSWSGPNSFNANGATQVVTNVTNAEAGFYVVTGTDGNGCSAEDSIEITILALPILTLNTGATNNIYCLNTTADITASGAATYSWNGPNGYSGNGSTVNLVDVTESNEGYYFVTGTDGNGCSSIDSIQLIIAESPTTNAPSDTTLCPGESLTLIASGGESYVWDGPGGFSSTNQSTLVSNNLDFVHTGEYIVTITDSNGCIGSASTYVVVEYTKDCLFIPTLVTPNLDGQNDLWIIHGIENFVDAEVQIFNRWGNLIFTASPYNNDWDATVTTGVTIDGKDGKVPVGTYFYIINLNEGDYPPYKGYLEVEY